MGNIANLTSGTGYCIIKLVIKSTGKGRKMKIRHRYFGTFGIFLLLYLIAVVPYLLSGYLVNGVFEFLCIEMPEVFRSASFLGEPEKYEMQTKILTAFTVFIAMLMTGYLSLLLDNKRMEYIARRTDGKYRLAAGLKFYYSYFGVADVICGILPPALLAAPIYFVPEEWLEYGLRFPLWMGLEVCTVYGFTDGLILLIVTAVASRFIVAPLALARWRAAWLSGTAEVI